MEVACVVWLTAALAEATLAPGPNALHIHLAFSLLIITGPSIHPGVCQAALPGIQSSCIKGKARPANAAPALHERVEVVIMCRDPCE